MKEIIIETNTSIVFITISIDNTVFIKQEKQVRSISLQTLVFHGGGKLSSMASPAGARYFPQFQ